MLRPLNNRLDSPFDYDGNSSLYLPPKVLTVNKSVRDGLQYIEQKKIAMALDDAFLPIPNPIW
jgi:hypothetical protein